MQADRAAWAWRRRHQELRHLKCVQQPMRWSRTAWMRRQLHQVLHRLAGCQLAMWWACAAQTLEELLRALSCKASMQLPWQGCCTARVRKLLDRVLLRPPVGMQLAMQWGCAAGMQKQLQRMLRPQDGIQPRMIRGCVLQTHQLHRLLRCRVDVEAGLPVRQACVDAWAQRQLQWMLCHQAGIQPPMRRSCVARAGRRLHPQTCLRYLPLPTAQLVWRCLLLRHQARMQLPVQ